MGVKLSGIAKSKLDTTQDVTQNTNIMGCKCRYDPCPLGGACETQNVIYRADISNIPDNMHYYGASSTKFISRWRVHQQSLQDRNHVTGTALSSKVWELRNAGYTPEVKFSLVKTARSALAQADSCKLCIEEKKIILYDKSKHLINTREEIFSRCRHRARWKVGKTLNIN